jgi:tetratricopeptide (TPR) repeat protein
VSEALACDQVAERGLVERYLARRLSSAEEEAFEAHYLTCARCQSELRLASGVRAVLGERSSPARTSVNRSWPRARLALALGAAAAAGVAAVLLLKGDAGGGQFSDLGRVIEPPVYLGVPVRGNARHADSLFEAGMAAYGERRYAQATSLLSDALAAGADSAPAEFFRASSLLMTERFPDAAAGFARVAALGETPYLTEARYFRAKALLRLDRAREALAELRRAEQRDQELAGAARALGDSVEARLRR